MLKVRERFIYSEAARHRRPTLWPTPWMPEGILAGARGRMSAARGPHSESEPCIIEGKLSSMEQGASAGAYLNA
jgi:hypothetical protein